MNKAECRLAAGAPRDRRAMRECAATPAARCPSQCPPSPPQPKHRPGPRPLPAQIGKYRILGRLGDGATSEVFLGYDDFQRRNVAIKRVRAGTIGDPVDGHYSERFFAAEAALVGRLQHPNVVQIFDAVPDPVAPYLVMEYVAGSTLRPVLPRRPAAARSS